MNLFMYNSNPVFFLIGLFLLTYVETYSQTVLYCYELKGRPGATGVYYGIQKLSLFNDYSFQLNERSFVTKQDKKGKRLTKPFTMEGDWQSQNDTLKLFFRNTNGIITRTITFKQIPKGMYDVTPVSKDGKIYKEQKHYYRKLKRRIWRLIECSV